MFMLHHLWGIKTVAAFDVWSFEHLLSGISIGYLVTKNNIRAFKNIGIDIKKVTTNHFDIVGVLFVAYFWEAIEHYLETGLVGSQVQYWFQGVEFWPNRIITDPIIMVLGYLLVKKVPRAVNYARATSLAWLYVHVFVFPQSMYLQEGSTILDQRYLQLAGCITVSLLIFHFFDKIYIWLKRKFYISQQIWGQDIILQSKPCRKQLKHITLINSSKK